MTTSSPTHTEPGQENRRPVHSESYYEALPEWASIDLEDAREVGDENRD